RSAVHQLRVLVILAIAIAVGLLSVAHERGAPPDSAAATPAALGLGPDGLGYPRLSGDPDEGHTVSCPDCLLCKALVLQGIAPPVRHAHALSLSHRFVCADVHIPQPTTGPPPARAPPASLLV